jgi:hypothetical protein
MTVTSGTRPATGDVDRIRAEVEATRSELAETIDELAGRTDPRRVVHRGLAGVRERIVGIATVPVRVLPDAVTTRAGELAAPLLGAVRSAPRRLLDLPGQAARAIRSLPVLSAFFRGRPRR